MENSGINFEAVENRALTILDTYDGANNFIVRLKQKKESNKNFIPTRSQCDYIINFHNVSPKVAKKWVELDPYFAKKFSEEKLLPSIPEQIWVEKLLVEKDKSYHIWGKFFSGDTITDLWMPKSALIKTHTTEKVTIDYSKYDNRPPMEHQKVAIEKLVGTKKFILADSMGVGKSISASIAALETGVKKILIICPSSLKLNWKKELEHYTNRPIYIAEGKKFSLEHDIVIVNYDILKNFYDLNDKENSLITKGGFELIIADECFTYDTKIMTEFGEKCIGDIVEFSMDVKILTYNHTEKKMEYKKINRWIRKHKDTIYKIKLNNGTFIECTDNHKFYVNKKGYVKARELTTNDDLYMLSKTINEKTNSKKREILFEKLFDNDKKQNKPPKTKRKKISKKLSILWGVNGVYYGEKNGEKNPLFGKLFKSIKGEQSSGEGKTKKNNRKKWWMVNANEKNSQRESSYEGTIFGENEKEQSYGEPGNRRKNEKQITWKNFFVEGWERENNITTGNFTSIIGRWVVDGITNINKRLRWVRKIITECLQSGYWKSSLKDCRGSRWKLTQNEKMEVFRQKKNRDIEFVRVESIEVLERGSYDKSSNLHTKNTRVYDLEIEDNHNYFANSILVSNCHFLQNPQANRTKIVNSFVKNVKYLWLLTGTPMTSRPMNYFNLLSLVESPVAANWMAYAIRYCEGYQFSVGRKKIWNTSGASNLDELRERTSKQFLRRLKEDVLDLPEKIITPVYLDLKSKDYEELVGEYYDWYNTKKEESKSLTIQFSKLMKVRQVIANEKIKHTIELAENIIAQEKKVIIFTNFTNTLQQIHQHFGKKAVFIDGSCSTVQRQYAVDQFQENDKVVVFVGNLKAAGAGITLTAAEACIMNDLSFVPSDHQQAEDRAYRYGQKNCVSIYYPLFHNTIEGAIYDILSNKKNVIDTVMGDNIDKTDIVQEIMARINAR